MGRVQVFHANLNIGPKGPALSLSPQRLMDLGCNLRIEVATATAFVSHPTNPITRNGLVVWAHLDTGASKTTISGVLAAHLGLVAMGSSSSMTANGQVSTPTYAVDLLFVGTTLSPKIDWDVGSCTLPFTLAQHQKDPSDPRNFAVLIGRDVMAAWHIAWDGPSSGVIISE
jgi:hypothetical protein